MYMNPVLVLNERIENKTAYKSGSTYSKSSDSLRVLIATVDHEIRTALTEFLESANIEAIWVTSVKDMKARLADRKISACFCGFWLQDGTYREVIRHLRLEKMNIPAIIISAPACPQEFRDYLTAMNLGSLDVLSYPYQQDEFERMLEFAIPSRSASARQSAVEGTARMDVRGAA